MWWPWRRRRQRPVIRISSPVETRLADRYNSIAREVRALNAEYEALGGREPEALTAAGNRVLNGQATLLRRLIMPWQIRSFGYYDMIGEIKYAAQFYSRSLANLRLYVAKRDENGELEEVGGLDPDGNQKLKSPDDQKAVDALDRIRDPGGGGRSGLLASYGRLMFLVGETYLFVTQNSRTGKEQWEMLSTEEIRLNDGLYTRFKAPSLPANQFMPAPDDSYEVYARSMGADGEQYADAREGDQYGGGYLNMVEATSAVDNTAIAYRLWRRHPRFSDLADATMQGVLELCEELVLLTQAVRARARSRLAGSGVLFVDDRISPNPLEPTGDEDILVDPFFAALTAAMTAPIVDEGTAAAVVPLIARVRVPDGMKLTDMVYHLQIIDPMQVYPETGLRAECIKRIATGLDMPSDILLGITDANHWTAWMVDEQSWKAHLQPVAMQLVEDLTSAYLGPYLQEEGVAAWDDYVVAYDAAAVINHPDRGKDANDAWDRGTLSEDSYRAAKGFDEKDAPDDEERMRWLGVQMRDPSLAVYGIPALRSGSEIEPTEGTLVSTQGTVTAPTGEGETAASAEKTPPDTKPQEAPLPEDVLGSAAAVLVARIEGAALTGILRARDAAGAKLRTTARRDDELAALIDGVPNRNVAAVLGAARVRGLIGGSREATLLNGVNALITDSLRMAGLPDDDGIAEQIADTVAGHALRTLYDERPSLSATFPDYVRGLITPGR